MSDFVLLAIFLSSGGFGFWLVSRKISFLLQLPEELIIQSFVTRPSRIKLWTQPLIDFFREEEYKDLYYSFLLRMVRRSRIILLKLERISFQLVQSLQTRTKELSQTEERYWQELKRWKHDMKKNGASLPDEVLNPQAPPDSKASNSSPGNLKSPPG